MGLCDTQAFTGQGLEDDRDEEISHPSLDFLNHRLTIAFGSDDLKSFSDETEIKPDDRVVFIGSNHDYLDNGEVLEVKEVQGTIAVCDHSTRNIINIRVTIADLRPCHQ